MKIYEDMAETITVLELVARAPQWWLDGIIKYEVTDPEAFFNEQLYEHWFDDHYDYKDMKKFSFVDGVIHATIEFFTEGKRKTYVHSDGWTEDYATIDEQSWLVSHNIPKELLIQEHQYFYQ
jgi:hypothetical protein